jgi:parvulin-like peptidyl-prolyl isomerase
MDLRWRFGFAFLLGLAACRPGPPARGRQSVPLAVVNGEAIELNAFNNRVQRSWNSESNEEPPLEVKLYYLHGQIEECLVLQEARRLGVEVSRAEEDEAVGAVKADYSEPAFAQLLIDEYIDWDEWQESLRRQLLLEKVTDLVLNERIEIPADAVAAYYRQHAEELAQPAQVHALQAVLATEEEADNFRLRVMLGENFTKLAKSLSQGPEAEKGGDLGWLSPGQVLRPLDRALFSLSPGKVSDPVHTDYGFHVLLVVERRDARVPGLAEMKPVIERQLRAEARERLYRQWVAELLLRARIKINYQLL